MRVFARYFTAANRHQNAGPVEQLDEFLTVAYPDAWTSFFCILPDHVETLTGPQLRSALSQICANKQLELACPVDSSLLVCRPEHALQVTDGAGTLASKQLFSITTDADVACLREGDAIFVLALANSPGLWEASVRQLCATLPDLAQTRSTRPLSGPERRLRDLERPTRCVVPRDDTLEPVFCAAEMRSLAQQDRSSVDMQNLAQAVKTALVGNGFLRVRLTPEQVQHVAAMGEAQIAYFALPDEVKRTHSLPRALQGMARNYQPVFGYCASAVCSKEYFVVRQPIPVQRQGAGTAPPGLLVAGVAGNMEDGLSMHGGGEAHTTSGGAGASKLFAPSTTAAPAASVAPPVQYMYELPTHPVNLAGPVWPVFHDLGSVCQDIIRLLFASFDIDPQQTERLLQHTMSAASSPHEFNYTSTIELFRYHSQGGAGERVYDGDSNPDAQKALPCSIHMDASLLTCIPRCTGPAGLELYNFRGQGGWQAVEEQARDRSECIVFAGEMLGRVLNGAVLPAQHRVIFSEHAGLDRYSAPFELFPAPSYVIDCAELLKDSWHHFPSTEVAQACQGRETAQVAMSAFSQGLVSVNQVKC